MRLIFEIKKIIWSPLYWLLLLFLIAMAYLPISQRVSNQESYIENYKEQLNELTSVLAEIKIEENSEETQQMMGLKSDIESVGKALDEGHFELIPNYRKLMYQDLADFTSRYGQIFRSRQSLTPSEVKRLTTWNDWLIRYQLADGPEQKGWSTGRVVQSYLERLFDFIPLFLILGFMLAGQMAEKTFAHQRWQLLQWNSLGLQGMRRLFAYLLSFLLAVGTGLSFIFIYDGLTGQLNLVSLLDPVELFGESQLVAIWLYAVMLLGFLSLLVFVTDLLFAFLNHLLTTRILFFSIGIFLSLVLAYQTGVDFGWTGQFFPLLDFPVFLDQSDFLRVCLQIDLFLLFFIGLFVGYYLLTEKKLLVLTMDHQRELKTGSLDKRWSFECLLLRRYNSWKWLLIGNLLLVLFFSLFIGLQKQKVAQEERSSIEMMARSYENDRVYVETLQEEINHLRYLVAVDTTYEEELEQKIALLQEYRIYKDLYVTQWKVYQEDLKNLPITHLAMLKVEQTYLWGREERVFAEGGIGASKTIDNLRRYQTRNQISQYYWENVIKKGVPANKRGKDVILSNLESRFAINDAILPTEDPTWDQSIDRSGIGSLRSLFDGPLYLLLLLIAVWIGSRGKAVEVSGNNWRMYQTQPVNLKRVLVTKWLIGVCLSIGFTLFFLINLLLLNGLVSGWGYADDGIMLLSHSKQGMYLNLLHNQELWVWFLSNKVYLVWMVLGILCMEIILVSLNHLVQVYFSNRLVVYLLLVGGVIFADYLLFQELILDGQEIFRQVVLLYS